MQSLVRKRSVIKGSLTRITNYVNNFKSETDDINEVQVRLDNLSSVWESFNKIQEEIEEQQLRDDSSIDYSKENDDHWSEFEGKFYETKAAMISILKIKSNSSTQPICLNDNVKLPRINLPTFAGDYSSWRLFYESFLVDIHNVSNISDIKKFQYLISSLKSEALDLVSHLGLTSHNYNIAWNLLIETYDNKRLIVKSHVSQLFDLSKVNKESASALKELHHSLNKHLRALKALGEPTDNWNALIVHLVSSKLDPKTLRAWEGSCKTKSTPTYEELDKFLREQIQMLEAVEGSNTLYKNIIKPNLSKNDRKHCFAMHNTLSNNQANNNKPNSTYKCALCLSSNHNIYRCFKFLQETIPKRIEKIKALKFCTNCLKKHDGACTSESSCRECGAKHNTLLHLSSNKTIKDQESSVTTSESNLFFMRESNSNNAIAHNKQNSVLLATAVVLIEDGFGKTHECRALLDGGSHLNLITERLCQLLKLSKEGCHCPVASISGLSTILKHQVNTILHSRLNYNYSINLGCFVTSKIAKRLPLTHINVSEWPLSKITSLADETFNIPGEIDLLIGASVFFDLLLPDKLNLGINLPVAQNTHFGYVISGVIPQHDKRNSTFSIINRDNDISLQELNNQLKQFWKLDEVTAVENYTTEEKQCEDHFSNTHYRNSSGRFVIKLPFKKDPCNLGSSRELAIKRFHNLEKRFSRQNNLKEDYTAFIKEYIRLGYLTELQETDLGPHYFLPHHAVTKDSCSTALRVVFDASAKTSSNSSLNDLLFTGPSIQDDLISIILRFRLYKYVFTADISKMYCQIIVQENDRRFQLILWRDNPTEQLKVYSLTRVTFGLNCSPFLATRCLKQLILEEGPNFGSIYKSALHDFYMDDLISGTNDLNQAIKYQQEFNELLALGGFTLRKWSSNKPELLKKQATNNDDLTIQPLSLIGSHNAVKTLGLLWQPNQDFLYFNIPTYKESSIITKRQILSRISSIFDPLGFLTPVTIAGKLFVQKLWLKKLCWDEPLPQHLLDKWIQYESILPKLSEIQIPRRVICGDTSNDYQLIGFSDASELAYGCCIYLRSRGDKQMKVRLLCAKTRVAPTKQTTLARLELCGALLLAKLFKTVQTSLNINIKDTFFFTDSTIVLGWISSESRKWKTFVANRVAEIQTLINPNAWYHVNSSNNPADLLTRGLSPENLLQSTLWWNGPSFLLNKFSDWPIKTKAIEELPEAKTDATYSFTSIQDDTILKHFSKFSSWTRILRVLSYCFRFIDKLKKLNINHTGPIMPEEYIKTEIFLLKEVQRAEFRNELKSLQRGEPIKKTSRLIKLSPFLENQLLKVGGRLKNSSISYQGKYPILLPSSHFITNLILTYIHITYHHCGPQLLLSIVRQKYWPISGRNLARKITNKCVVCFKCCPREVKQIMGNLPACRVTPAKTFENTGIDCAGPLPIKTHTMRGSKVTQGYLILFICMATKALHLELMQNLTTESFIAALKRFISRRGNCTNIHCDNGTNFVGAMKMFQKFLTSNRKIISEYTNPLLIKWNFIPPRTPHFGGLWESNIKCVKQFLKKSVGELILTYEEIYTVMVQIESCLNSRPLCPLSNNPNDYSALTPAHFLVGNSLAMPPEINLEKTPTTRLTRWQNAQRLIQLFWKRWSREYLHELQQRNKWNKERPNLMINDLVLLKDDGAPPLQWRLARVVETHPGSDGLVRVVTVRTNKGTYQRSISKVCPLPKDDESSLESR